MPVTFAYRASDWKAGVWEQSARSFDTVVAASLKAAEWLEINASNDVWDVAVKLVKLASKGV
jgi:hypothetical protein